MIAQETSHRADHALGVFRDIEISDRLLLGEVLLRTIRTGIPIKDAIEQVDPDCEMTLAAEEIAVLHSEEPLEGILGVVLSLVLCSHG